MTLISVSYLVTIYLFAIVSLRLGFLIQNPEIWLSMAQFNQRAIKVYENAGFVKVDEIQQATNGGVYDFVRMKNHNTISLSKKIEIDTLE